MKISFILLSFLLSLSLLGKTYKVNSQHSFVNFEVDYMKVSVVKGAFEKFEGFFDWDSGKLQNVRFKIQAKTINTRDKKRDKHLKQEEFFHTKEFPFIEFKGSKVVYKDNKPVELIGIVSMKGVEKETSFDLKWHGEHQDAVDKKKQSLFLKANTVLKRKDFKLNWNKALDQGGWIVGEDVRVELIIEANPTDATPAFSRFFLKRNEKIKEGALSLDNALENPPEKKESITKTELQKSTIPSHRSSEGISLFDLILGFVLFIGMGLIGYLLKKKLQEYFESKMSEMVSELLSDTFLFSFLFASAWILAPLMGYQ